MARLEGVTVLEIGDYVAVPYAGKLLSDLGATVIKLEPPDGDSARSVGPFAGGEIRPASSEFFGYLNTGKESVIPPPAGRTAAEFVDDAIEHAGIDIVIEDRLGTYGIDPGELVSGHDDVSVVSVSGFGATGPFCEYAGPDLVAWAESGHMNKMGYADGPPTRLRFKAVEYWTGQMAAIGALTAYLDTTLQGAPGQHVDLAKREVGISGMEHFIAGYSWSGETTERVGAGYGKQGPVGGWTIMYETADGHVSAAPTGPDRMETLITDFLDRPELLEDERFNTRQARAENQAAWREILEEYFATQEKWDLFERFQAVGIPSAVVSTPADVAGFEHLSAREFWEDLDLPNGETVRAPGCPVLIDGERPSTDRAPRLGEHTSDLYEALGYEFTPGADRAEGPDDGAASASAPGVHDGADDRALPLSGIKVLDLSWVYAGPHASRLMAALGADVVKVESRHKPDSTRNSRTFQFDPDPTASVSTFYNENNLGKRAMTLDLTDDRGREIALDLVAEADVVMENFSPSFLPRVDLDYETLRAANPEIIYLSMPGWGKSGPAKDYRAYGITVQSMAGLDWLSGFPDDPPTTAGHSWSDPTNAHMGLLAVLAALARRERTGEGTAIESSLLEVTTAMMHKPLMAYLNHDRLADRTGNRDEDRRYVQGAYPCAGEDAWAVIAVRSNGQWTRLCDVLGRPELAADDRFASHPDRLAHHDALDEIVAAWTRTRSREEVRSRLQAHDVPAGVVADERDLMDYDPQLRARGFFTTLDHPEVGERTYQGFPFRMGRHDVRYRARAPQFGEHTEEVLEEWLGLDDSEIDAARSEGALH